MSELSNGGPIIIDETRTFKFSIVGIRIEGTANIKVYDNNGGCAGFHTDVFVKTNRGSGGKRVVLKGNETNTYPIMGPLSLEVTISKWQCTSTKLNFHIKGIVKGPFGIRETIINTDLSGDRFNHDLLNKELELLLHESEVASKA
ncbi:hypothetical protein DS884_16485 [Tenacibaculum sp. E3R01]|uniref:hypothetical protein n=1 Tax=Tenacibaculum sp. E3R01 TaxID=2267227 RepID=UPI000DE9C53F|nr:hypothetical protein [Tenacibaculum sp. E3R01]RBW55226.1 hypothetical protein DS884_16485 [Tenacibaculum sp. E3R01]